jgi:hypothetical protein
MSLHQRYRALRNLRAGPAFLTDKRIGALLAALHADADEPAAPPPALLVVDNAFDEVEIEEIRRAIDSAPGTVVEADVAPIIWAMPESVETDATEDRPDELRAEQPALAPIQRVPEVSCAADRRAAIARAAERVRRVPVPVARDAAPTVRTPTPRPALAPITPAQPLATGESWVERRVARERAAIAWLRKHGWAVNRSSDGAVAGYRVPGVRGEMTGSQVVEFAAGKGFEG